jgi:hypothetical protein
MDMLMHQHPNPPPKVDKATVRKPPTEAQPAAPVHADPAEPMRPVDHAMPEPEGPSIDHKAMGHGEMTPTTTGAHGPYPMTREASGTAWQPDTSMHSGIQAMAGHWMLMGHAVLNGVYS